ncbi:MAG TPA: formylglycine-generating enzyme family protein, partial [Polyangiaceae bacterium]|nr:formylglycine-generating enzyme family protein [Polyangiaceae bacterium]
WPVDVHGDLGGDVDGCISSCVGKCAGADDGCGHACPTDQCDEGQQCAQGVCTSCPHEVCNGVCCNAGEVCTPQGTCCTPQDCDSLSLECGNHDNGCGGSMACGSCAANHFCLDGKSCSALDLAMKPIPAGTFMMGSPTSEPGRDEYNFGSSGELNETLHSVTLTRPFEIGDVEVTQHDFNIVMGYNPSFFVQCGSSCPVETITFDEALAFCNVLSLAKGLPPCFECTGKKKSTSCKLSSEYGSPYECQGYRLPTEAEWEYAARAGTQTALYSGALTQLDCANVDPKLGSIGWYVANSNAAYDSQTLTTCHENTYSVGTQQVRTRSANNFGLYDMAGNVWEFVHDCGQPYTSASQTDPIGPLKCPSESRIFRGGGLYSVAHFCRHAERADTPGNDIDAPDLGFRIVRTLP